MPKHIVTVSCPVPSGFAVDQVRGMFDLAAEATASETFEVEVPADDEAIDPGDGAPAPWRIGVIVGPSGSGKTTVAREVYGKRFREAGFRWDKKKAVIEHFPGVDMRDVTQTLTQRRLLEPAVVGQAAPRPLGRRAVPLRPGPRAAHRRRPGGLRRVHLGGRPDRRQDRLRGARQEPPQGPLRGAEAVRGGDVPLRRAGVAGAGLGARHEPAAAGKGASSMRPRGAPRDPP